VRGNLQYWSFLLDLESDAAKARALLLQAKADLEAATKINPNQAGAWASLSHLYYKTNNAFDVNLAARRALDADAFLENALAILDRLFLSSFDIEQFTAAGDWCDEIWRRFPASANAPTCSLSMLATKGVEPDVARAWRLADSVAAASGPRRELMLLQSNMWVAAVLVRAGKTDSARRVIERSTGNAEIDPTRDAAIVGAFAYAQMGDKTKAIEMLKVYFSANPTARAGFAEEPGWMFRGLAEEPEFRSLVGAK
jgi:tetratricopeptide (TPR) repeat protein